MLLSLLQKPCCCSTPRPLQVLKLGGGPNWPNIPMDSKEMRQLLQDLVKYLPELQVS